MALVLDHELAAGYALDALDPEERRAFEQHLRSCTVCAEELPSLRGAAAALAYALEPAPAPPLRLPRPEVVPLRRRLALSAAAAVAVAAAAAGIALGLWPSGSPPARPLVLPIRSQSGSLVVTRSREAFLVLPSLPAAPAGTTYQAWVVAGGMARSAGTFAGGDARRPVILQRRVPPGARIAVSLEPHGGSTRPTGALLFETGRT